MKHPDPQRIAVGYPLSVGKALLVSEFLERQPEPESQSDAMLMVRAACIAHALPGDADNETCVILELIQRYARHATKAAVKP